MLDSINAEWNKQGRYIESVACTKKENLVAGQSVNGNTVSITQNVGFWSEFTDCFDQGTVVSLFGGMLLGAEKIGVVGTQIIRIAGGISAGKALFWVGAGYYAFRVGECHNDVVFGKDNDKSKKDDFNVKRFDPAQCVDYYAQNPSAMKGYNGKGAIEIKNTMRDLCMEEIKRQIRESVAKFKDKYGDTLTLAANNENYLYGN